MLSRCFAVLVELVVFTAVGASTNEAKSECPHECFCSKTLTSVNCGGKNLAAVPDNVPLQVEKLYLQSNKLSAIPPFTFANFTHLVYLDLRQNIITEIDENSFGSCPQLQQLYLTANRINKVNYRGFAGSSQLTYLSLGGNRLSRIPPLPFLTSLRSLVLEGNRIGNTSFPPSFSLNKALTDIVLSNNKIVALKNNSFGSLAGSSVLKVEISRNVISTVESGAFRPLTQLKSLKIGLNPLDSTQLQNVIRGLSETSLVSLDIRNLSLGGKLPSETFKLLHKTDIKDLKMSNNKIDVLPKGAFANLPQLILIDLSACKIQSISEQAFENLTELQTLFLNDNSLAKVPHGLPSSLVKLYLNNNHIDHLANNNFDNLKVLEELYLVQNSIHELQEDAFIGLSQLRKLHLAYNEISTLPGRLFYPFTRLLSLELNNNNIKAIPPNKGRFSSLSSLVYLNLDSNDLSSMPLDVLCPVQALQYLHLANNQMGSILRSDTAGQLFRCLAKLKELYLSNNDITKLPESMLAEQRFIQILNISKNRVSHWGEHFFASTVALRVVDLTGNLVSLVNKTSVSDLGSLRSMNLTGNPFACTCDAVWFCHWMNETSTDLPRRNQFICNVPSTWQGKSVVSFCNANIDCTDYTKFIIIGSVAGGFLLCFFVVLILYRYRWFVKYRFYKIGRSLRRSVPTIKGYGRVAGEDKAFDVYLSYADEDMEWVADNILKHIDSAVIADVQGEGSSKVCFRYRDFAEGRGEIASMDEIIPACRRAVVIVSADYVRCKRCEFELSLIQYLKVHGAIEDYHLVTREKLPLQVPKLLQRLIEQHKYIEYPNLQTAEQDFLDRLKDCIA